MVARADFFANSFLLNGLDTDIIERVMAVTSTRKLAKGETLFMKGDEGDAMFGVISGKIKISTTSAGGKEVILNLIESCQFFGEIAVLDGMERTADATAMAKTELLTIRRADFERLLESEPVLARHVIQLLCLRVRITSEMVEDAAFLPLEARLAKRLLSLSKIYGEETGEGVRIGINLPQQELGQMLSTSRESINKQLQAWRKEGWIDVSRSKVTVKDAGALQEVLDAAEE